jgi:hypothetical protein
VALFISGVVMALMSGLFGGSGQARRRTSLQTEAQQGLRALAEMITRELRQAGACLPPLGEFIALDGVEGGTQDSLVLRIGHTDPDTLVCVSAAAAADAAAGSSTFQVADSTGFEIGDLVYVTPNGASGTFYTVSALTPTSITIDSVLAQDHPAGTGIYAVDERVYAIDPSSYEAPTLTLSMDGGAFEPFVDGVEEFDVQFLLAPCPPCDPVDLPQDATEWRNVRELLITATVRSRKPGQDGNFLYASGDFRVKPRNLL